MTRAARDEADVVWDAAVGWVMREHEQALDAAGAAERDAWLAQSADHRAAYKEARYLWRLTGLLPPSR